MSFPTDHRRNTICCGFVEPNNKKYLFYPSAETIKGKEVIIHRFAVVVQSLSSVQLFATPWTAACKSSLSFSISLSLLKLMSIESVMPSKHLIFCHPLLLPSMFPSIRVFFSISQLFTSGGKRI